MGNLAQEYKKINFKILGRFSDQELSLFFAMLNDAIDQMLSELLHDKDKFIEEEGLQKAAEVIIDFCVFLENDDIHPKRKCLLNVNDRVMQIISNTTSPTFIVKCLMYLYDQQLYFIN